MQDTCVEWDNMIAESEVLAAQPCTECGKPSGGYRCCNTLSHYLCEACAVVLEDGYHYCAKHKQEALDEIIEREVYAALVALHQVCVRHQDQSWMCKEWIKNLGILVKYKMSDLRKEDR